jgi:8-oxo-dGTP diphosphatase
VVRDGKVLLGRRAFEPDRGKWDIPGGFLHAWELPRDGARREVLEETGLHIELGEIVDMQIDTYGDSAYTLNVYYLAAPVSGIEQAADDLSELRWFTPLELPLQEMAFTHCAEVLRTWCASVR